MRWKNGTDIRLSDEASELLYLLGEAEQVQQIVDDDVQFRMHVMESLGELKTDMKSLVGNGQPGRVSKLESKVDKLEWYAAVCIGAGMFGSYLIHWGWDSITALLR